MLENDSICLIVDNHCQAISGEYGEINIFSKSGKLIGVFPPPYKAKKSMPYMLVIGDLSVGLIVIEEVRYVERN